MARQEGTRIMTTTMADEDVIANASAEPKASSTGTGTFKIQVSLNGIVLGWMINTGSPEYWVTLTSDETQASTWYQVLDSGKTYLAIASNNYLSYRSRGASALGVKIRGWAYAASWTKKGTHLVCDDNGELLGTSNGYFYVNGESPVDVEYIAQ